jgi:hypothetical protein
LGDGGAPNPQSPIPNPQSPHCVTIKKLNYHFRIKIHNYLIIFYILKINNKILVK